MINSDDINNNTIVEINEITICSENKNEHICSMSNKLIIDDKEIEEAMERIMKIQKEKFSNILNENIQWTKIISYEFWNLNNFLFVITYLIIFIFIILFSIEKIESFFKKQKNPDIKSTKTFVDSIPFVNVWACNQCLNGTIKLHKCSINYDYDCRENYRIVATNSFDDLFCISIILDPTNENIPLAKDTDYDNSFQFTLLVNNTLNENCPFHGIFIYIQEKDEVINSFRNSWNLPYGMAIKLLIEKNIFLPLNHTRIVTFPTDLSLSSFNKKVVPSHINIDELFVLLIQYRTFLITEDREITMTFFDVMSEVGGYGGMLFAIKNIFLIVFIFFIKKMYFIIKKICSY